MQHVVPLEEPFLTPLYQGERVALRVTEADHAKARRGGGDYGVITDLDTGQRYRLIGVACSQPRCFCDAKIEEEGPQPQKRMRLTGTTITDAQIRELHNSLLDGTLTDAIGRDACHIALAERCIGTGGKAPFPLRYPTEAEIREARERLAEIWNRRHEVPDGG